jgi:hypothetical protein
MENKKCSIILIFQIRYEKWSSRVPIIAHHGYDKNNLEQYFVKDGGEILYGELDIAKRLFADCEHHRLHWHMWHSLRLSIPVKAQQEIEIDFFLMSEAGAIIIEVKGGIVECRDGIYYLIHNEKESALPRTPFEQAADYKHALIRNSIIDRNIFISFACAFPHTSVDRSLANAINKFDILWDKTLQDDPNESIAVFLENVIRTDRARYPYRKDDLTEVELAAAVRAISPNIRNPLRFSEENIDSFLRMINVSNAETLDSLRKNHQIVIEGKPGTGKTTFAKIYVAKHSELRGIYLCWNKFLVAVTENLFHKAGLNNCDVYQYRSFLQEKDPRQTFIRNTDIFWNSSDIGEAVSHLVDRIRSTQDFIPYDYIIVDESQDIFDKGVEYVLEGLTSARRDLTSARFLLFYDNEQGYKPEERELEDFADRISRSSAHFILSENKRSQYNKDIVKYAENIYETDSLTSWLTMIENEQNPLMSVERFCNPINLLQRISCIQKEICEEHSCDESILLLSSNLAKVTIPSMQAPLSSILAVADIRELNEKNICLKKDKLFWTTMLKYKGLECPRVFLAIRSSQEFFDSVGKFELYVGMTRAIAEIRILVLEEG